MVTAACETRMPCRSRIIMEEYENYIIRKNLFEVIFGKKNELNTTNFTLIHTQSVMPSNHTNSANIRLEIISTIDIYEQIIQTRG